MALAIGKLTILIGAGVVGSILAKEGRIPGFSDVLSGALKVALKPLKQNDSAPATSKPRNDALIAQVNNLRQELQLLASSRPVTIVTSSRTGGRRSGVVIVIVVLGYGYVWWKGWKLPDFMCATKRGLKDACNSVAKELDKVFHSVKVTKKDLSFILDESSCKHDEIVALTTTTKEEVAGVRGKITEFSLDIQSVNDKIRSLETNMSKIQRKQEDTKEGVGKLLLCARNDLIQLQDPPSASKPALEHTRVAISSRAVSLPASMPLNLPSPSSSNGSCEMNGHLRRAVSTSGVKEPGPAEKYPTPNVSNGSRVSEITENLPSSDLSPRQPVKSPGWLSWTVNATKFLGYVE